MSAIRVAREANGFTQEQLGLACGVTGAAVSAWELGAKSPRPSVAKRLTEVLPGLTLEQIYTPTTREAA